MRGMNIIVTCVVCGRRKKPVGRSAPVGSGLCDHDCEGYCQKPFPGTLWPDESPQEDQDKEMESVLSEGYDKAFNAGLEEAAKICDKVAEREWELPTRVSQAKENASAIRERIKK